MSVLRSPVVSKECTQVQSTLILISTDLCMEGKPIRHFKVNFRLLGEVGMLQVHVASCISTAFIHLQHSDPS